MNIKAFLTGYMTKHASTEHCTPNGQVGVMNDAPAQTAAAKTKGDASTSEKEGKIALLAKIKKEKKPEYPNPDRNDVGSASDSSTDKGDLT
jgi:hypothetical protein